MKMQLFRKIKTNSLSKNKKLKIFRVEVGQDLYCMTPPI